MSVTTGQQNNGSPANFMPPLGQPQTSAVAVAPGMPPTPKDPTVNAYAPVPTGPGMQSRMPDLEQRLQRLEAQMQSLSQELRSLHKEISANRSQFDRPAGR